MILQSHQDTFKVWESEIVAHKRMYFKWYIRIWCNFCGGIQ